MHLRVTFVAAARSASLLAERFEDDRPLGQAGWDDVQRAAPELIPLAAAELRYCLPTPRSRAAGDALGYTPLAQPALWDCDMGRWRGFTLGEAMAREPQAVDAWLADPRATPHGGESLQSFIIRVGGWLDTRPADGGGRIVAVAEPSVVRAALVYALKAPPATYWNIDVRWPTQIGDEVAGQAELDVGDGDDPGPARGLPRGAQAGGGPAEFGLHERLSRSVL